MSVAAFTGFRIGSVDLVIILLYLVVVVGIGIAAGFSRKKGSEGSRYFLAGNTLGWPMIGLAMFAANISTVHLVSLAQSAYTSGLLYGNFEWMAGFTLIALALFFAPLYLRSKVSTLPDYLERRFNRSCRDWLAVVSLFSAIVIHIGVALYTASWVLCYILGIDPHSTIMGVSSLMFFIIVLGVLTGLYTMLGGLLAVVWTESVQTVLLLVGAFCITVVAYVKLGGWSELAQTLATHPHPLFGKEDKVAEGTSMFLTVARSASDPCKGSIPWYSILLGYNALGIWYWCADQTIVQRVLAAKDEMNARLGPLFCAFLKILPVFFFVLPGVLCVALVQKGFFVDAPTNSADVYPFMITHLLPWGLKGLVTAAMLAAAMQTCSAALNSTATLVAYDIVQRWRPQTADHQLVTIGKIVTVLGTILAIVMSPIFDHYPTIFEGINKMISYVAPPISAVFVVGVFWKKASGRAALLTLIVGGVLGLLTFPLDFFKDTVWVKEHLFDYANLAGANLIQKAMAFWVKDFMLTAFALMMICVGIMIIASKLMPEPLKEEAKDLVWDHWLDPVKVTCGRGLSDYRVMAVIAFAIFIFMYIKFW